MKTLLKIIMLLALTSCAWAVTPAAYAPGTLATSCANVTSAVGLCTPLYLPGNSLAIGVTWQLAFDTGTASSVSVTLKGSNDNVTFTTLDTNTSTSNNSRSLTVTAYKYLACSVATYSLGTTNNLSCQITVNTGGSNIGIHGAITPGDCTDWFNGTTLGDAGAACGSGGAVSSVTGAGTVSCSPTTGDVTCTGTNGGDTITSPNSTINVGGTASNTTLDVAIPGANHDLLCSNGSTNFIACGTGAVYYTSSTLSTPNLSITGTTPGAMSLVAGTGNIPALPANSWGFAGPASGGTSALMKPPATSGAGIWQNAACATGDNVNECALSFSTALANGTTGTTQSVGDNSTKVATTAYVDRVTPAGKVTNRQLWTMSTTGLLASPITLLATPFTTGIYNVYVNVSEAATGNCTTPGNAVVRIGYADPDSGLTFAVANAGGLTCVPYGATANAVNLALASTITTGQIWTCSKTIYAATGTSITLQTATQTAGTSGTCNVQATFETSTVLVGPF